MADELKRSNGFIPGVKPGKPTKEFLDSVMSKITLPGAVSYTHLAKQLVLTESALTMLTDLLAKK